MALILLHGANIAKQQTGALGAVCLKASNQQRRTNASNSCPSDDVRTLRTVNLGELKRGTGGRSSFNGMVVTVFGCTGFVGRYVANKFGKIGSQLIFPYRADHYEALRLRLVGDLGQTNFQFYSLHDDQAIRKAIKYSNVVVNLVGRDWETKNFDFEEVHVTGARRIARACKEMGVEKLIHLSALNASAQPEPLIIKGGSKYLASKYRGELAVRDEFPDATIIRPADIYGQEDRFLRYYAHLWRRQFRSVPLWHKGERTVKQPVAVSDVAQAIVNAARDPDAAGKVYQAVGPRRYRLSELVDWFHREMRKDEKVWQYRRYDMRWDPTFMWKVAFTQAFSPGWPIGNLHPERVEREHVTDVVEEGVPTLEDLGVSLTYMEDQVPWELAPFRAALYYDAELNEFEKPAPPKFEEPNVMGCK